MSSLDAALSTAELLELETFLNSGDAAELTMDIATLEGYLTVIVIGPQLVPPSQWLPWVWDMDHGLNGVVYADMAQASRFMGLVMRMMNSIADTFMRDPAAFEPIYRQATRWGAAEWCEGFMLGTQFSEQDWDLLWLGKPALVTPFLRLGTADGIKITRKAGDAQAWMEAVQPALVAIHGFWLERRANKPLGLSAGGGPRARQSEPVTRPSPKVGRNEACPCGSGKKFKKCCGATNSTLH